MVSEGLVCGLSRFIAFSLWEGRNLLAEGYGSRRLLTSQQAGSREGWEELCNIILFKVMLQ